VIYLIIVYTAFTGFLGIEIHICYDHFPFSRWLSLYWWELPRGCHCVFGPRIMRDVFIPGLLAVLMDLLRLPPCTQEKRGERRQRPVLWSNTVTTLLPLTFGLFWREVWINMPVQSIVCRYSYLRVSPDESFRVVFGRRYLGWVGLLKYYCPGKVGGFHQTFVHSLYTEGTSPITPWLRI